MFCTYRSACTPAESRFSRSIIPPFNQLPVKSGNESFGYSKRRWRPRQRTDIEVGEVSAWLKREFQLGHGQAAYAMLRHPIQAWWQEKCKR
jgi:hypothetical protein